NCKEDEGNPRTDKHPLRPKAIDEPSRPKVTKRTDQAKEDRRPKGGGNRHVERVLRISRKIGERVVADGASAEDHHPRYSGDQQWPQAAGRRALPGFRRQRFLELS